MAKKLQITNATILSANITIAFIAIITIISELVPPLKTWLKTTFSHHWVGKGIFSILLFIILSTMLSILPTKINKKHVANNLFILFWTSVFSTFAVFGFFLWETFHAG